MGKKHSFEDGEARSKSRIGGVGKRTTEGQIDQKGSASGVSNPER